MPLAIQPSERPDGPQVWVASQTPPRAPTRPHTPTHVALSLVEEWEAPSEGGSGTGVYLTPDEAEMLAAKLLHSAAAVRAERPLPLRMVDTVALMRSAFQRGFHGLYDRLDQ